MKHLDNRTEVDIPYRMTGFLSVYEQARAPACRLARWHDGRSSDWKQGGPGCHVHGGGSTALCTDTAAESLTPGQAANAWQLNLASRSLCADCDGTLEPLSLYGRHRCLGC